MEKRSIIRQWNFLQSDSRLKGVIAQRLDYKIVNVNDLAREMAVKPQRIRDYLKGQTPNLNNFEIVKLAHLMGLELSVDIKLRDDTLGVP